MTFALVRRRQLDLETFARACDLHPELVRRLVALGLVDAWRDHSGDLWFAPQSVAAAGRLERLRLGLSLNYASLGVVVDLLDRIAELEAELRTRSRPTGDRSWTSTD